MTKALHNTPQNASTRVSSCRESRGVPNRRSSLLQQGSLERSAVPDAGRAKCVSWSGPPHQTWRPWAARSCGPPGRSDRHAQGAHADPLGDSPDRKAEPSPVIVSPTTVLDDPMKPGAIIRHNKRKFLRRLTALASNPRARQCTSERRLPSPSRAGYSRSPPVWSAKASFTVRYSPNGRMMAVPVFIDPGTRGKVPVRGDTVDSAFPCLSRIAARSPLTTRRMVGSLAASGHNLTLGTRFQ